MKSIVNIRIRLKKDDKGDIQTRTIEMADVIPVVFPPLTDVPYRRLGPTLDGGWEITSLPDAAGEEASGWLPFSRQRRTPS